MKEQTTPLFDIQVVQHVGMPKKCKGDSCCNCSVSDGSGSSSEEETDDIDSVKSELSGEINTVNTRLSNHISDTHCHTTNTEKNYWNNKLDATTFDTTIAALRSDIPLNPITSANLADALEALGLLDGNHNPSTGGGSGSGSGSYLKAGDFLGTINNISFVQGDDITIPVGSDPSTWDEQTWQNIYNYIEQHGGGSYKITGLSFANNVLTIQQENNTAKTVTINAGTPGTGSFGYSASTTSSTPNSYLIGTITYNGNSYPIYGKDGGSADIDLATDRKIGGILIGYTENAADRNYPVLLDGGKAYVHVPWRAADEVEPGEESATKQELEDLEGEVNSIIEEIRNDLNSIHNTDIANIDNTVNTILSEWGEFKENPGQLWSNSNFGTDATTYVQQVINTNLQSDGAIWSKIIQQYNILDSRIDGIVAAGDGDYAALETSLKQYVDEKNQAAIAQLTSSYILLDSNGEDAQTLEWMLSGFKTQSSRNQTFAQMWSDCNTGDVAAVKTSVEKGVNAEAYLAAMFGENLSGANAKSDLDHAIATLFAQTNSEVNGAMTEAGVVTKSNLSGAVAEMFAKSESDVDTAIARIAAKVNDAGSEVYIEADKIKLTGNTTIYGNTNVQGALNAIVGKFDEVTVAKSLRVGTAGSSEVYIDTIEDAESPRIAMYDNNGLERTVFGGEDQERDFDNLKNYIRLNGSGYFAGGNFSWNSDGNVRLKNAYVSGDIDATSFKVKNGEYDSIVFTTYNSSTYSGSEYSGLNSAGLQNGDPIGLVYDSESHTPKYFFDFAPVNQGTFSADAVATFRITPGASAGTVNITYGPVLYYVTDSNDSNYHKYITTPRANGKLADGIEDLYEVGILNYSLTLTPRTNGTGYRAIQPTIWKPISFTNGVKNTLSGAYIVEGPEIGAKQLYGPSTNSTTINKGSIYGNESGDTSIQNYLKSNDYTVHYLDKLNSDSKYSSALVAVERSAQYGFDFVDGQLF